VGDKNYYLELLRASKGTFSRQSRTNPHWARVVGYGLFFLYVIHKEVLCPTLMPIDGRISVVVGILAY
jgi:hypothetical protein